MAVKWSPESDITNKTMEEMLIEVFGCSSPDSSVIKLEAGRERKRINKVHCVDCYTDNQDMMSLSVNA
ncbi:MAG: hypothetical protein NT010_08850 [Proteobacteria bacterium]|nr:hypothetical protein [Pseudomonadota bacterium]